MKNAINKPEVNSYKDKFKSIRISPQDGSLNAIIFKTSTLSSALHRHDFDRIDYGDEIAGRIEILSKNWLIQLTGENLEPLFEQIVLNNIYQIKETNEALEEGDTAVRKILIAPLNLSDEE